MRVIVSVLISYCLLIGLFYIFQRNIVFRPAIDKPDRSKWYAEDLEEISLQTDDHLLLFAWYKAPENDRPIIVYFHGNAGHIGERVDSIRPYLNRGYGIMLVEYRGYAGNPGRPSEQGVYKDGRAAMQWLKQNTHNACFILYGESLGSGVAVQMATEYPAIAVILESPFSSLTDVAHHHYPFVPNRWLLTEKFDSINKLDQFNAPLLVFQGLKDTVVPAKFSQRLFDAASEPKKIFTDPNGIHSNLVDVPENVLDFIKHIECQDKPTASNSQAGS